MNSWAPCVVFAMLVLVEMWKYRQLEKRVEKVEFDNVVLRFSRANQGKTLQ